MLRVRLLRSKCNGCSYCAEIASEFWDMNFTDGKVDLIGAKENKGTFELLTFDEKFDLFKDCETHCSTKAIKVDMINVNGCC